MTHPVIADVTARIADRSAEQRTAYLDRLAAAAERGPARGRLACANLAHGFAASDNRDKRALRRMVKPNIAIVSSYNDMLSAHKPFESYPAQLKQAVIEAGGIAQFEVPDILLGAGTIVDTTQPKQALAAGAQFLVSPGSSPSLRAAMRDSGLPHLPGVATVSEVMTLLEDGYTDMKFFPAEPAGGAPYLKAIHSPVPAARFCPTGGITPMNLAQYLKIPNVGCVGGSWLTPSEAVERKHWATIASLAAVALELANPTMRRAEPK